MTKIIFKEGFTKGTWFLDAPSIADKHIKNVTKFLGGKDVVKRTRYYCKKGLGSWQTDWEIAEKNREYVNSLLTPKYEVEWVSRP